MSSSNTEEDLKRLYAKASSERLRAEIELQFWTLFGNEARKREVPAGAFLNEKLGVSVHSAKQRLFLARQGAFIEPIWPLVEGEMTLSTAVELVRRSKSHRVEGEEDADTKALVRAIEKYNRLPIKRPISPGKFVRMRQKKRKGASKPKVPPSTSSKTETPVEPDSFRSKVRGSTRESLTERLAGLDDIVVEEVSSWFETSLKILFDELDERVRSRRREHRSLHRYELVDACRVLHLDPPEGSKLDGPSRDKAKRNFKALARQYHPDVSGESTRAEFDAVMKAWSIIQAFF